MALPATEAFTGANDTSPPNANWTNNFYGIAIQSNGFRGTTEGIFNSAYWNADTFSSKHYAKAKAIAVGSGNARGPAIRVQASAHSFYYCIRDIDGNVYNGECVAESSTDWDSGTGGTSLGDVLELAVDASTETTIYFKVNGSTTVTYTSKSALSGGAAGVASYGGSTSYYGDDWEGGDVGGTAFNQSATGGFTPAGAILKQDAKVLTGATTPAGALLKQDQKILTGATTPVGAILNQAGKVLAGAITPTGVVAALRTAYAILTGAITPAGTLVKETQRALTGAVTPVGALLNQAQKILSGDITPTSTLGTIKTFLLDLVGSITPTGNLLKETQKIFTGSITPVGSLLKEIQKAFSGSITPTGAFAGIKVAFVVLVGSITPTGNLLRETQKTLTGVVTPLGLITKLTGKLLDGILAPTGALVTLFVGAGTTMAQSTFKGMFRGMFRRMR